MTAAEQLVKAQADLKAAQDLNSEASTNLSAKTTEAANQKARADKAEGDLATMKTRAEKAEGELATANAEIGQLKAAKKSTDGAAAEQLARNGVTAGSEADVETTKAGNGDDVAALADKFVKADINTKRVMLAGKDGERLRAYVAEQQAKRAKG